MTVSSRSQMTHSNNFTWINTILCLNRWNKILSNCTFGHPSTISIGPFDRLLPCTRRSQVCPFRSIVYHLCLCILQVTSCAVTACVHIERLSNFTQLSGNLYFWWYTLHFDIFVVLMWFDVWSDPICTAGSIIPCIYVLFQPIFAPCKCKEK